MISWYTPEEFLKKFNNNQALIEAVLDTYNQPLCFREFILRVCDRNAYAEDCRECERNSFTHELAFPLIDKKNNLVFEVDEGAHGFLRQELIQIYEERGNRNLDMLEDDYIKRGYGYFLSSVSVRGMTIGKILFDKDLLDEDDAAILLNSKLDIIK